MQKASLIFFIFAVFTTRADSQAQDSVSVTKAWEEMRRGVKGVECKFALSTTQYKRKSPLTGKESYPADIKTTLDIDVYFDFEKQEYQIKQLGKVFQLHTKQIVDYKDSTTLKGGKIYGYRAPPPGRVTGVGTDTGVASDLAIIEGGLDVHLIPESIVPTLYPIGIIPLSPIQSLTSASWSKYLPSEYADLMMPSATQGQYKTTIRQNQVFEGVFDVDRNKRITSICVNRDGKPVTHVRLNYSNSPEGQLSGWTRSIYSGGKRVTLQEATVSHYRVLRTESVEHAIQAPGITPGMVVAKIPTLDTANNTDTGRPPVVNTFVADQDGQLMAIPGQRDPGMASLRSVVGIIATFVILCWITVVVRRTIRRK